MKTVYALVSAGLRRWIGAHPSNADWIAWRDHQLSTTQGRRLQAHLRTCAICRLECGRLEDALSLFSEADALSKGRSTPVNEGLEKLKKQIQAWRQLQEPQMRPMSPQLADGKDRWKRVSLELEVYLGNRMTDRLIEAARQSDEEMRSILATAKPVLTGLLGEQAAFNVTTQLFRICAPKETPA